MPNKQCFAKLDSLSSKPKKPFNSANEIINDFENDERTKYLFAEKNMKIIIREWVDLNEIEFRCFIKNKKLRGISSEGIISFVNICKINNLVEKIIHYTEYEDCCIDMTFYCNELLVIKINTPLWLFSTSGYFYLDDENEKNILLGDYYLGYPVLKYSEHNIIHFNDLIQ